MIRSHARSRTRLAALICLAGCGSPSARTPSPAPAPAPVPAPARPPISNTAPAPAPAPSPVPPRFPTLAAAGGATCKLLPPVRLGPIVEDHAAVGLGAAGGLAAWKREAATLALQPLALDGATRGAAVAVPVAADLQPKHVFALDRGFLVLLVRWDWRRGDASWWGVVADPGGRPARPPADLGMAGMDVKLGQPLDGDRVGLVLLPAAIAKSPQPSRWQTLAVAPDGGIASTPVAVGIEDFISHHPDDDWVPAARAGKRGWSLGPEGLYEGVRAPSAGALPLAPGAVRAAVRNLARPNPRGPGGTIIESMARPALERTHAGRPLGPPTLLEVGGAPVGVTGFMMSGTLVWTGTHFLYAYADAQVAALLPVDCRP